MTKEIKIIKGVYGHKNGNVTIPKTTKDAPFTVDDKVAQRLIAQGVAELAVANISEAEPIVKYSVNLAKNEEKVVKKEAENTSEVIADDDATDDTPDDTTDELAYSDENTKEELLDILKQTGYEITAATKRLNKAQVIALLDEQTPEDETPDFNNDDGVVE